MPEAVCRLVYSEHPSGQQRLTIKPLQKSRAPKAPLVLRDDFAPLVNPATGREWQAGYGGDCHRTIFTRKAKERIQDSMGVLEDEYRIQNCLFFTGTLPGSTPEALQTLARYTGFIVKSLYQWFARHAPTALVCHVWEWQDRGALHIHMVCASHNCEELWLIKCALRKQWIRLLQSVSVSEHVDLFGRIDGHTWRETLRVVRARVERIEKTLRGYMSKYLGKGQAENSEQLLAYPSRWWGMTDKLRDLIRARTTVIISRPVTLTQAQEAFIDVLRYTWERTTDGIIWKSRFDPRCTGFVIISPSLRGWLRGTIAEVFGALVPVSGQRLVPWKPTLLQELEAHRDNHVRLSEINWLKRHPDLGTVPAA